MDRKDLDRPEYGSYEEVHEMLVRAMQDACMNDTSREYEPPQIDMSFLYEDEKPNKTMVYKIIRSAAILFLVFGMLLGINAVLLTSDSSDVYGEKGLLHRIHEGVRGIFTDEDPSQYVEVDETGDVYTITRFDKVDYGRKIWKELCIPEYIPSGYDLKKLEITKNTLGDYSAIYHFGKKSNHLKICVYDFEYAEKHISKNAGEIIELNNRMLNLYYDNMTDNEVLDMYLDTVFVCIYGDVTRTEILEIAANIY